ncbi:helix-turn-helix transcriptional regulator [Cohnella yongneupensis]|uniref:Helix-turn-helix transcriptional regulator n=1 Tax=Cohnella yongneupensis TaxID=425006 RepID=A0ABW0R425_9BACL
MKCLELPIPPLPQCLTVGNSVWSPGMQHAERNFLVYDLLIVKSGRFNIMEEDTTYELDAGGVIMLEPGRTHRGHHPVTESTEIYWAHFLHTPPARTLEQEQIPWSYLLRKGTDGDTLPSEQFMYVPKCAYLDTRPLYPVLDEMVQLHRMFSIKNALRLQLLSAELLYRLQAAVSTGDHSRSYQLAEQIMDYLHRNQLKSFDAADLEAQLHFNIDYLTRCLKLHTGLSPLQYLHRLQMESACSLLLQSDWPIQEIGERVGQPNANYFIRLFRKSMGISPGKYRAQHKIRI